MDRLSDYDYDLPERLIAQIPLADRSASRLLVLGRESGQISDQWFRGFPALLEQGDVLVLNETRVTAKRLHGNRAGTGGAVELLILRKAEEGTYLCLAKPAKRLTVGVRVEFDHDLRAEVVSELSHGERLLRFEDASRLDLAGDVPLPPYIRSRLSEPERYQTVYSRAGVDSGSAAAPTAGLHFTEALLAEVVARGAQIARISLEVGIDTFRPVQVDHLEAHEMHGERCQLSEEAAAIIAAATGRIVAVGTTTVRTLETFARLPGSSGRHLAPGSTTSTLFLRPPGDYRVVDAILTNFHMPRTTMMMMISAFAGREAVLRAYRHAVQENYRFLSFGDAMFLA